MGTTFEIVYNKNSRIFSWFSRKENYYILTTKADVNRMRSRTQSVEQSKLVSSHLFGFVLNESAYSTPCQTKRICFLICIFRALECLKNFTKLYLTFNKYFNSGQMNELPAYAASTWSHTPGNRCNAIPISSNASNEHDPVVPNVVSTKNGTRPCNSSSSIALVNVSPRKLDFSSGSRMRSFTKHIIAAFSTQLCASFEQYAINFDSKWPSSTNGCCCFRCFMACARAASIVTKTHSDADVYIVIMNLWFIIRQWRDRE